MPNIDKNEEVIIVIDGSGPDGKYQEGDDIKEEVIETLAGYLHCLTKDGRDGNKFQLSPNVQKRSMRDENGDPAPLDDRLTGATNAFAPTAQNPSLRGMSDSGKIFKPTIGEFLTKGKADTFLRDIEGSTDTSGRSNSPNATSNKAVQAVVSALDNNRFSPGPRGPFINEGTSPKVFGRQQKEFGKHNIDGKDIRAEDLQKIGHSLMLRAAREIRSVQEGDPDSGVVGLGSLIPGAAQIGVTRVDTNRVRAAEVMEENFGYDKKPRTDTEAAINPNNKSWGHLNTPLEPFSGFLPIGMTIMAPLLAVALRLVTKGLLGLLALMVKEKSAEIPTRGPFITGEWGKADPPGALFSLKAIGINPTERDFLTAVNAGLDVFFEFSKSDFKRVVRNPQFYVIFTKNIIRSGNTIVNEIKDVFSSGQNPLAAAQAFLGLIDVLKSSKIISFLNIMAQIGDKSLEIESQGFKSGTKRLSSVENLPNNPATNVMRIRDSRSKMRSGMATSATLSKFLFSKDVLRAGTLLSFDSNLNFDKAISSLPKNSVALKKDLDGSGRIKRETVMEIESELDSEYVPFYFHDLRTNEIVSFHAFLDGLEDAYAPQYESTQAYGRIDNVRTYASTERTINVSFNIVSTNKEDFDVMWWKINKLTSMVYPSWTEGRQVSAGDTNFIQPFSQLPGSTPVIRMRVGDMIRSNYSKFAVQRIFGVGSDKTNIVGDHESTFGDLSLKVEEILNKKERMLRNPAVTEEVTDGYQAGETAILLPKRSGYVEAPESNPLKKAARAKALFGQEPTKKLVITASTKVKVLTNGLELKLTMPFSPSGAASIKPYGEHQVGFYVVEVEGAQSDEMKGTFLVTHDDLVPDPIQFIEANMNVGIGAGQVPSGLITSQFIDDGNLVDVFSNPFNPLNNSIIRSFESTQGKGLAGVITALTFNELASPSIVWETSEFGSRAPKTIKVSMTFAVIHDIAPGLDETGFMRAIQYPVGNVARHINGDTYEDGQSAEGKFTSNHMDASVGLRNPNKKE